MPIEPIKPKGFELPERELLRAELDRLGRQVVADTKAYPPWRPWSSRPPASGPRRGGRRTGALGKSWEYNVGALGSGSIALRVQSKGVKYARYVQGRNQTRVMRGRGWKTVQANFRKHYPEAQKRIAAWGRLRTA